MGTRSGTAPSPARKSLMSIIFACGGDNEGGKAPSGTMWCRHRRSVETPERRSGMGKIGRGSVGVPAAAAAREWGRCPGGGGGKECGEVPGRSGYRCRFGFPQLGSSYCTAWETCDPRNVMSTRI
jgi:hypothetical protein